MVAIASVLLIAIPGPASADTAYCTSNATKQCIGNIVYWYNSCGALESIAQNCNVTGQVCQSAQCVTVNKPNQPVQPTQPAAPVYNHYTTACYQNNLYWYNQQGAVQDIFKNCNDNNSCTNDSCGVNQCVNALTCDGSTCAVNSPDYIAYCQNSGTPSTISSAPFASLTISLFAKKEADVLQWSKTISATGSETMAFIMVVKNASAATANNVTVRTNLPAGIAYAGNLNINNADAAGNLAAGINLGTFAAKESKIITFSGTTQPQTIAANVVITATVTIDNSILTDTDTITITIPAGQSSITTTTTSSGFMDFLKKWYVWLIITAVLAVLFVIIFRRLSSSV